MKLRSIFAILSQGSFWQESAFFSQIIARFKKSFYLCSRFEREVMKKA